MSCRLSCVIKKYYNFSFPDSGTRSFQFQDVFSLDSEGSEDVTTLIDKKVQ